MIGIKLCLFIVIVLPLNAEITKKLNQTRRIIKGRPAENSRPYMVWLRQMPLEAAKKKPGRENWLCGGSIINARFILSSAACIEDVKHIYAISGLKTWVPQNQENECIKNGKNRIIWKCVPKDYYYDGDEFNNILWMMADLAVLKTEEDFVFDKVIVGCDYAPRIIKYNNESEELAPPDTVCTTAGWGSIDLFADMEEPAINSRLLLETDARVITKKACKSKWPARYHDIIDEYMICTEDGTDNEDWDKECIDEADCQILLDETDDGHGFGVVSGGICQNDHGGPLVFGVGMNQIVVGIISACQIHRDTRMCYGPYLYTNVFKFKPMLGCIIDKTIWGRRNCMKFAADKKLTLVETAFDWSNHPDGPAKDVATENELKLKGVLRSSKDVVTEKELKLKDGSKNATAQNLTTKAPTGR